MRDIKVFNTVEEVYEILGKKAPARKYQRYCSAIQENAALWLNGGKT